MTWLKSIDTVWLMMLALALAAILTVIGGKFLLPLLIRLRCGQTERDDGPESHLKKTGTPTMGGLMMLAALLVTCILLTFGASEFSVTALLVTFAYGLIGFLDDYIKVVKHRSLGLNAKQKLAAQVGFALVLAIYAYRSPLIGSEIYIPFWKHTVDLGWFYIPFVVFVVLGTTNSVNLTDGLDGLASSVTAVVMAAMAVVIMLLMRALSNDGSSLELTENLRNLMTFSATVAGACLGFLYYNHYPAKVFMGDTGSMALGAAVVAVMVLTKNILLIPILGITYLASSLSVIIQVGSYKLRNKKRVFLMAPLHHHFEKKGYSEVTIDIAYVLVTAVMAILTFLAV